MPLSLQRLRAGVSDRRRPANNGAHAVHEAPVSLRDLPASVSRGSCSLLCSVPLLLLCSMKVNGTPTMRCVPC
jgi:hypothetical protein